MNFLSLALFKLKKINVLILLDKYVYAMKISN